MKRVDNLILFLILVESLWVSLYLVWCWLLACCILPLLCLEMFLISLFSPRPLSWRGVGFCQKLFPASNEMIMWFLFQLFIWWITLTDFHVDLYSCISGMKPTWSRWLRFLMCSWIWFASILLSVFASMFMREIGL